MSEHRTTMRGVEQMAADVLLLAKELGCATPDEEWYIEKGSSTNGTKWKLYASKDGGRTPNPIGLTFTGQNNYIGSTARQARDFLEHIWEGLNYVQAMQVNR